MSLPPNDDVIKINLTGLNLDQVEKTQLQDHLKQEMVVFLKKNAKPIDQSRIMSGPGWIGQQRD